VDGAVWGVLSGRGLKAANSGHPSVCIKRQVKTDCRHRAIRNARSTPDIDISSLTVSNVASI
jgi:hypothetical protein